MAVSPRCTPRRTSTCRGSCARSPSWLSPIVVTDRRTTAAALAVLALLAAGCEPDSDASSDAAASTGPSASTTARDVGVPAGFDRTVASLESPDDDDLVVGL